MKSIILASSSVVRKELFAKLGVPFECIPSTYEEDMTRALAPDELVKDLAYGKAHDVAQRYPDAIVIGVDTIIAFNGTVQGKPHTQEKAREVLSAYSAKCVDVMTGVALIHGSSIQTEAYTSKVWFKTLSENQIEAYIATGEPLNKAGAFAIQGLGGELIDRIEGDYEVIVGLPTKQVKEMLTRIG